MANFTFKVAFKLIKLLKLDLELNKLQCSALIHGQIDGLIFRNCAIFPVNMLLGYVNFGFRFLFTLNKYRDKKQMILVFIFTLIIKKKIEQDEKVIKKDTFY